jgi:hypothetical protein
MRLGLVFRTGEPLVKEEVTDENACGGSRRRSAFRDLRTIGFRSAAVVPMRLDLHRAMHPTERRARGTLAVGGHPLPLLGAPDGITEIGEHGLLLDEFENVSWRDTSFELSHASALLEGGLFCPGGRMRGPAPVGSLDREVKPTAGLATGSPAVPLGVRD